MTILLAGDIGGTKTILRLVDSAVHGDGLPTPTTLYQETYASQRFPDLVPMVQTFLAAAETALGSRLQVARACFGIAGPVINNASELTNLHWSLQADRLEQALAIPQIALINDFAAVGYGVLGLTSEELYPLQVAPIDRQAPIAVLGAGTGLGECFLTACRGHYHVYPSEGSHADFAPRSPLEDELRMYLQAERQLSRVSVERVVSGRGIASIYQFLRQRSPEQESPALATVFQKWQQEQAQGHSTIDVAAAVSKAALEGHDPLCTQAMQIFLSAYGAEAGNFALKLLPYGGLYIAGGIAPKILPLLEGGEFMAAFKDKGRFRAILEQISVQVVLNPQVGLLGAALYAAQEIP
ncbi:glucokinase [Trichothermofontia sichuanensis B231]|uniref:glucokinase n=1 Tax=Trichothermofontia sichuanensis TaxID=3045816 RepID=UPI002247ADCC|nr:glucokinase [Trichothermofontia sichuanensis]UZQ56083.1 glucokinase [Trichothermofontia sichuanensis B231]